MQLNKIHSQQKIYVPALFNFRELKGKHKPILDKIKQHITKTLPKLYNITESEEDYNLFYSNYKYGEIFCIRTEYLHTLSNIFQFSYKYQITITLEELIYMVSFLTKEEHLETLKVNYRIKTNDVIVSKILSQKSKKKKIINI